MVIGILSLLVFVSGLSAIIFRQKEEICLFTFFKPFTTILIIVIAVIIHFESHSIYSNTIIYTLFASLAGDIFLINKKYFLYGLTSFLLAHIGFTIGFASLFGFSWNIISLMILMLVGVTFFIFLRKDLGRYRYPVAIYISVIVIMNWQGINLILRDRSLVHFAIAFATLLFSFSDSIIAYNIFRRPFKIAEILILSTYWTAIYILTISGLYI